MRIRDVATPFDGELCYCHRRRGDGIDDLVLDFHTRRMVDALELHSAPSGNLVTLTVSGMLLDGTPFEASDCIRIIGRP